MSDNLDDESQHLLLTWLFGTPAQRFSLAVQRLAFGTDASDRSSLAMLTLAADGGHEPAIPAMVQYFWRAGRRSHNPNESLRWWSRNANQGTGSASACYVIGRILHRGDRGTLDGNDSAEWIQRAYRQGRKNAFFLLGEEYYKDLSLHPSDRLWQAKELWEMGADNGCVECAYAAAKLYLSGELGSRDQVAGEHYLSFASNGSHREASERLLELQFRKAQESAKIKNPATFFAVASHDHLPNYFRVPLLTIAAEMGHDEAAEMSREIAAMLDDKEMSDATEFERWLRTWLNDL